ncbi:UDP-N-acetylmuramate--L-alanine ligase [Actinoplanes sp. NBRC 103695]|uniref:UDP-N-acetylmuramate--L-alanine ligase n=1 Tax=Actinoplanes sp. NBRC 103695 TaxID=3032202 RepID=UPI0024A34BA4|nr:UDP-N-acetylmuramate--L-alanine ligase [Actinoplanes sp. NBRC 103695]GLY99828.1 UDP-N-acetylmuramate--L-alanine ligase [Actinoplanes sp. NBRC 103695]
MSIAAQPETPLGAAQLGRVHFVGIGGVGMSAVARLLLGRGLAVQGSELASWPVLDALRELGATIFPTHDVRNLAGVDTVIYSTAIPADHPELVEARDRGLRIIHRSQALAAAMTDRDTIAVAGSHGKTTTSTLTSFILQQCGADPSYVIGGVLAGTDTNAHSGTGTLLVAEADESDRTFLHYQPFVAIVTNIGDDHLSAYGTTEALHEAFQQFTASVRPDGFLIACADDHGSRQLAEHARQQGRTVYTYGQSADADLRITDLTSDAQGSRYLAVIDGEPAGEVQLPMPGEHVSLNSAAAALTAVRLGHEFSRVAAAIAEFPGVGRRLEHKGTVDGVRLYDEYSFHPRSMATAIRTMRQVTDGHRLLLVFQPLRMGRTTTFLEDIATALGAADDVIVLNVFDASTDEGKDDLARQLVQQIPLSDRNKTYAASWKEAIYEAVDRAAQGDVVMTMGAPPIGLMAPELMAALHARAGQG